MVGLFGKKRSSAENEPRDDALPVLSVQQAGRLRALVRDAFARSGREVIVYSGHVEDDTGAQFGLDGLARRMVDPSVTRSSWPTVVDEHVRRLTAAVDGPNEFDVPLEDLLPRTYLRLYDPESLPDDGPWSYRREAAPGVLELLALDTPDAVGVFNDEHVARYGLDLLRRAGYANLRTVQPDAREQLDGVQVLVGESMYLASTALVLPEVVLRTTGEAILRNGVLVAMPFRHQLLYHVPRDGEVVAALHAITRLAGLGYSDGIGQISPHVFWWNDGEFTRLTELTGENTMRVIVSGEFAEVFTRLTADQ